MKIVDVILSQSSFWTLWHFFTLSPKSVFSQSWYLSFSQKDKWINWNSLKFWRKAGFKGYFLCGSNWLIVIKAWSCLIENVQSYQSLIATLIWKGHTSAFSFFFKCHDLIHFFWHFLCHKEGIFSVPFSSNFKLFLLQIIVINVIKS